MNDGSWTHEQHSHVPRVLRLPEPGLTEWGNYRIRVADPEGYEWTFGTHRPGLPSTW